MRIAIIGAGSVGAGLVRAWLAGGEDMLLGVGNPLDAKYAELPKGQVKKPVEAA